MQAAPVERESTAGGVVRSDSSQRRFVLWERCGSQAGFEGLGKQIFLTLS